jgi:hypothetical protein
MQATIVWVSPAKGPSHLYLEPELLKGLQICQEDLAKPVAFNLLLFELESVLNLPRDQQIERPANQATLF